MEAEQVILLGRHRARIDVATHFCASDGVSERGRVGVLHYETEPAVQPSFYRYSPMPAGPPAAE